MNLEQQERRGKSQDNQIAHLRPYVLAMMRSEGRNFKRCELCSATIPGGEYEIHHTKYDGATYRDLRIVCRSCNKRPENCLLE